MAEKSNKHGWKALNPNTPEPDPNKREWAAVRRRYEWNESYDEGIAPKDEELEHELFGEENHVLTGHNFSKYEDIKVTVKGSDIKPVESFDEANLHPQMKENVALARYEKPTPVQKWSIPIITEGHDLMACAQTGSGKTAAFLVPILSRLFGKAKKLTAPRPPPGRTRGYKAQPLVLILAPTRELATQIFDECRRFTYRSMLRPCVVYGGADSGPQKVELFKGCDILTATPGRLCDFLDRGIISLARIRYLVIDEADRMLDMGFEDDMRRIVAKSDMEDASRQTLMFSATFPQRIRKLAKDFLQEKHLFLTVGRVGGTTSDITQKIIFCEDSEKRNTLVQLLLTQPPSRTLIFVETKRGADSLDAFLYQQHFPTTSIHGDRTQREREDALLAFKNGRSPILIATAVAARGLDIKNVMHVINYDLCSEIDEYVHRIGRTARVGNQGLATTFYNHANESIAKDLVRLLLECEQEVPDFLQQYTADINLNDDDDDDTYNDNTSYSNHGQQTTTSWDNNNTTQSQGSWNVPASNTPTNNGSSQFKSWETTNNGNNYGGQSQNSWGSPQPPANQAQDSWGSAPSSHNTYPASGQNWSSSPQPPNNNNTYQQNYQQPSAIPPPANQAQDSWAGGPPPSNNNFSMPGQTWSSSPQQPNNNSNNNTYQPNYPQTQAPASYQQPPQSAAPYQQSQPPYQSQPPPQTNSYQQTPPPYQQPSPQGGAGPYMTPQATPQYPPNPQLQYSPQPTLPTQQSQQSGWGAPPAVQNGNGWQ
ncbi:2869_t:CDS:10 [Ambispora leptoticha]|uniref:ATP-dependent RNA helicase DED1 n=1 Tax=Ambispora leptoticha TaxID=144679 RepID=A0A9N8WNE2_9GLOM|nr:2869_t:CDS:10 [Ambispora leptoticha]